MLHQHRARNKPNKPPNQERLFEAARRHFGAPAIDEGGQDNEADECGEHEEPEEENESINPPNKRAARHSKSDKTVKPTTAGYYAGTSWKTAIVRAKLYFRRYTALEYLFPLRDSHLTEAELILSKVVADARKLPDVNFSSGKLSPVIF